jgi:Uroporphyrinogen-III synthase
MTTLLFTRPRDRVKESLDMAEEMGFEAICFQSVEVVHGEREHIRDIASSVAKGSVDITVFASATAVTECFDVLGNEMSELFQRTDIVAIGPGTKKELEGLGLNAMIPEDHSSVGLVEYLKDSIEGKCVAVLRSNKGSDVLKKGLEEAGAQVTEIFVYGLIQSSCDVGEVTSKRVDVYAFTSAFSAKCFFCLLCEEIGRQKAMDTLSEAFVAAIGKPTAGCLERMGIRVDLTSKKSTFKDLLTEIRIQFGV